ncbi:MAG: stage II sporulation protein M [bacterium]
MIFDVERFIAQNKASWEELEAMLDRVHQRGFQAFDFDETNRFHYLYHQTSSDLNRIQTFSSASELTDYLEGLVSRAYAEIYSAQRRPWRVRVKEFYMITFPAVFRRHLKLFYLALAVMLVGGMLGGSAVMLDPQAKDILISFPHLKGSPFERVLREEEGRNKALDDQRVSFSSYLVTHNIQVSLLALALGITFGLGTLVLIFYNGIILGAVVIDYFRYGVGTFAAGWLLPHGAFEIWAILIAGQAGFLIAQSMLKGGKYSRMARLSMAGKDILTLFLGLSSLLVWAGIVEAFFSQYHQPIVPYSFKILFGLIEILFLMYYFGVMGRREGGKEQRG